VWRTWLLPPSVNPQLFFTPTTGDPWLARTFKGERGYDRAVRELLTAPAFGGDGGIAQFYQANEFKPENLAGNTARVFLGVSLECARCHDHPCESWKRQQFWEYAAFFSEFSVRTRGAAVEGKARIKVPGTDKVVQARFLDGSEPALKDNPDPRIALADWI